MRQAITPHERLTATLRFLANGRTYEDLKFTTLISPQSLGRIIPETCEAIFNALKDYCKAIARFGILKTEINMDLDNIIKIVMACCALHNYLRRNSPNTYTPLNVFDSENFENNAFEKGLRMRNYRRKTERGTKSVELMQRAANIVLHKKQSLREVCRAFELSKTSLSRFIKRMENDPRVSFHRAVSQLASFHRAVSQLASFHRVVSQPASFHRVVNQPASFHRAANQLASFHRAVIRLESFRHDVSRQESFHRVQVSYRRVRVSYRRVRVSYRRVQVSCRRDLIHLYAGSTYDESGQRMKEKGAVKKGVIARHSSSYVDKALRDYVCVNDIIPGVCGSSSCAGERYDPGRTGLPDVVNRVTCNDCGCASCVSCACTEWPAPEEAAPPVPLADTSPNRSPSNNPPASIAGQNNRHDY
ncbi:unnamed protein product [Leptidea sinapis]|uniref:DDE Tnp4 domain-containing protein n=1 Tax=Leptidea sinapis TaxID=189913 RepID=A0A5E4Q9N4_9NEOP|nr:unnamed protein product [Leptidea sinapis]